MNKAGGPGAFDQLFDNNCYGQIWSGEIGRVCEVALQGGPWVVRRCDRSAYDGHWRLRIDLEGLLDLEANGPLSSGSYLFNGLIELASGAGERALIDISDRLKGCGIAHRFELYDLAGEVMRYLNHLWPDTEPSPVVPLWTG